MRERLGVKMVLWIGLLSLCLGVASSAAKPGGGQQSSGGLIGSMKSPFMPDRPTTGEAALPAGAEQGWWSKVQKQIKAEEYQIVWVDDPGLHGKEGAWQAHNRAQGFRTRFTERGIEISPSSEDAMSWRWGLELVRWGREGSFQEASPGKMRPVGNRVDLDRRAIQEWYINDERGIEQGFTLSAAPVRRVDSSRETASVHQTMDVQDRRLEGAHRFAESTLHLDLALTGTLHPRISEDGQAVDFRIPGGNVGVLRYTQLKVTDATGRVLPSRFEGWCGYDGQNAGGGQYAGGGGQNAGGQNAHSTFHQPSTLNPQPSTVLHPSTLNSQPSTAHQPSTAAAGGLRISIDDAGAVYPITVDPLATSPSWTANGENVGDQLGNWVATAGDVNGDGYSDVLVSASYYASNTGKVYLYLGSPSGLSGTASWTKTGESADSYYGLSAATAGDVNGDGYSDVVIGAPGDSAMMGKAYLYLGGSGGLSSTASWTAAGQENGTLGYCVSAAGDVNGDGYCDVLVSGFGSIFRKGVAYLYLGGASGLSTAYSWSVEGQGSDNFLGTSLATAGDVNGDGYADVVIGAWGYSTNTGQAFVYVGGSSGLSATAFWTGTGENSYDQFGNCVATAGDVNGDGFSDILVGAYGASSSTGRAYLFQGGGWTLPGAYSWIHPGENLADSYAWSVASAGDVDGDGYTDVLVGAPTYANIGRAYLYLGGSGGLSYAASWTADGEASGNRFGHSLASAGDVNGDGYADVVVGSPMYSSNKGRSYLYLGGPTGLSASASWAVTGNLYEYFGKSVASAGDVNGDGYSDLLVGASGTGTNTGKAYVYLGVPIGLPGTPSWTASGEVNGNNFGNSVSGAGDVNGDGYSDIVVSAYRYSSFMGKVYLYMGSASGLSSSPSWTSSGDSSPSSYFGYSVAGAGDVNGDGYSDLLVSAYYYGGVGRVYLYPGGASGLSSAYSWTADGEMGSSYFGRQVARAGDVNGDGYSDVIVGAPGYSSSSGRAYIYLGGATGLTTVPAWTATGDAASTFGTSVAAAGDVNGDGFPDVLVGSDETAYMYFGNGGPGVQVKPWQFRAGSALHISPLGRAVGGLFDVSFTGRAPFGRGRVKLQWQIAPLGGTFDPALNPIQSGASWSDSGTGGAALDRQLTIGGPDGPYLWRIRAKYDVATTPFQSNGPWFSPAASSLKETDLRKTPTCILPTGACSITSVVKGETSCTFTWQDPNDANQRTGWNVRRSSDASLSMTTWPAVGFNIQDGEPEAPDIQWSDSTGDVSPSGVWFYQITTYNFNCPADGPF